ncbi:MAG: ATP-binding protein [Planctomycetota bacterium]|jgi:signal transduction histidine kinase/tetratricopeptide (TPR) repeat protein
MKSKGTTKRQFFRRRQFRLFLLAVVLPCTVLTALTWRLIGQQQELSEKRSAEERRRLVNGVGQMLLAQLEEIKLHEISARVNAGRPLNSLDYTSGHVFFVGLADENRLTLPWEDPETEPRDDPTLLQTIRAAQEQEFVHKRYEQAGALYRECIAKTPAGAAQANARLLLARVLFKAGRRADGLEEYRRLAGVSPQTVDEHGVAYRLYAASQLTEKEGYSDEVTRAITGVLESQRWLSPAESFMLRDMIDSLSASNSVADLDRPLIEACRQDVSARIRVQEEALAVQRDFAKLNLLPNWNGAPAASAATWAPFGEEPLLVSLTPPLSGDQRLAIVVRGGSVLDALSASISRSNPDLTDFRLTDGSNPEGAPLGPGFPGLNAVYATGSGNTSAAGWDLARSFYLVTLLAVLCVVVFGAYFFWRDVTMELRMAEMRSQFIASVSHELKTPLAAIRILAETLLLDRVKKDSDKAEYLDTIVNESHRLTRLLNNVLDFSKIEKGKRAYRMAPTRPEETARAAARAMRYPLSQQDFKLTVDIEDPLPEITADPDAIEQALLNLISNAMKYSGESRDIGLRVTKRNNHIEMEVSDHGIGIEPGERQRIFEKFYRVRGDEAERVPGTGLGLALVSHIVEAHGGHIEVQSEPGRGSAFSIHLPLEAPHEQDPHR